MQINDVMTTGVATCQPETNLAAVAKLMWDHDCGFVPVLDAAGSLVGVLTDRDICIASATRGLPPERITAGKAMRSQPIHTCQPGDTIESALDRMQRFQVRRLPVVSGEGRLQGVVSMNDFVLASQGRDGPSAAAIVGAMAAICAHRDPLAVAREVAA